MAGIYTNIARKRIEQNKEPTLPALPVDGQAFAPKPASPPAPNKTVKSARQSASTKASTFARMLADDETIEIIRKAVRRTGEKVTYIRLTKEEKTELKDIIYTYERQDIETSENEIGRIGLKWLVEDYKANARNSVLAKVLDALNR
jgi:hypothetical protein